MALGGGSRPSNRANGPKGAEVRLGPEEHVGRLPWPAWPTVAWDEDQANPHHTNYSSRQALINPIIFLSSGSPIIADLAAEGNRVSIGCAAACPVLAGVNRPAR